MLQLFLEWLSRCRRWKAVKLAGAGGEAAGERSASGRGQEVCSETEVVARGIVIKRPHHANGFSGDQAAVFGAVDMPGDIRGEARACAEQAELGVGGVVGQGVKTLRGGGGAVGKAVRGQRDIIAHFTGEIIRKTRAKVIGNV